MGCDRMGTLDVDQFQICVITACLPACPPALLLQHSTEYFISNNNNNTNINSDRRYWVIDCIPANNHSIKIAMDFARIHFVDARFCVVVCCFFFLSRKRRFPNERTRVLFVVQRSLSPLLLLLLLLLFPCQCLCFVFYFFLFLFFFLLTLKSVCYIARNCTASTVCTSAYCLICRSNSDCN